MNQSVQRTRAYIPNLHTQEPIEIFGYTSKGLPGLEIVGLGSLGRSIKEKLIYISRENNIKIPLKRYVICLDAPVEAKANPDNFKWFEFPLLVMFWKLSGHIQGVELEDYGLSGKVLLNGKVVLPNTDNLSKDEFSEAIGAYIEGLGLGKFLNFKTSVEA